MLMSSEKLTFVIYLAVIHLALKPVFQENSHLRCAGKPQRHFTNGTIFLLPDCFKRIVIAATGTSLYFKIDRHRETGVGKGSKGKSVTVHRLTLPYCSTAN